MSTVNHYAPLRIGVIAPPWLTVPPKAYGGTELVVDVLCRGLKQRGHEVELFTLGSSTCDVRRRWVYDDSNPDLFGATIPELRHVAAAYDAFADVDIIHDHTIAGLFVAREHSEVPVVATCHMAFDENLIDLYGRVAARVPIIAVSNDHGARAAAHFPIGGVIHHGLDLDSYPVGDGDGGHLLALGRMSPDKGIDVAIEVARLTGRQLLIAAKMQKPAEKRYFHEVIEPQLGDGVHYVGEVGHQEKVRLLAGAQALLNPMQWPEPFGLVTIESLACGTPVIATPCGAGPEIIEHGVVGHLGADAEALAQGVEQIESIDRRACRSHVERHFSMARMAADHEALYRRVISAERPAGRSVGRRGGRGRLRPAGGDSDGGGSTAQSITSSTSPSSPVTATA